MTKLNDSANFRAFKPLATSVTTITCLLAAAGVQAQGQQRVLEEVVVSATKRDTMLQDTPIAVSAFDQEALTRAGLSDVSDLAAVVPNLSMGTQGFSNSLEVSMRGITSSSNTASSNPAVSVNLDGVYIPRPQGANALFYDVERVEVLRGPQGTLFGRNATAGAINVVSARPTGELEGSLEFVAGNYDLFGARAVINLPVSDTLSVRASLQVEDRDGYFDNGDSPGNVDDYGAADQLAGRISALYTPTDEFSWLLVYESFSDEGTPTLGVPNPLPQGEDVFDRAVDTNPDFPGLGSPELDIDFQVLRSRMNWDFTDGLRLTWVAGYGSLDRYQVGEIDGGVGTSHFGAPEPFNMWAHSDSTNDFFSHDLQLQSTDGGDLEWTIGAFYFEEDNDTYFPFQIVGSEQIGMPPLAARLFWNKGRGQEAWAGYAQGTYSLSDELRVTVGARYTEDKKIDEDANVFLCAMQPDITGLDPSLCMLDAHSEREEDFDAITWRAGIDWDMTQDILLYGSAATGFKSGGFSNIQPPYDEETVLTLEAGMKGTFLDGTLRLNTALFSSSYEDLQVSQVEDGTQFTENAAEATINGLEIEGTWLIGDNTTVEGFISWLDAEFDEYENACDASQNSCSSPDAALLDLSGNKLSRSPEWSLHLAIQHDFALGSHGTLTPRLAYHWEDESYLRVFNNDETDHVDSWSRTDASLTYVPDQGNWEVQVFVKNIEDDEIKQTAFVDPLGGVESSYSTPRTYGIVGRYHWGD